MVLDKQCSTISCDSGFHNYVIKVRGSTVKNKQNLSSRFERSKMIQKFYKKLNSYEAVLIIMFPGDKLSANFDFYL